MSKPVNGFRLKKFYGVIPGRKGTLETGQEMGSEEESTDIQRNGMGIMSAMVDGVIPKEASEASECFVMTRQSEFLNLGIIILICGKRLDHIKKRIGGSRVAGMEYLHESLEVKDGTLFQNRKCAISECAMQNAAIDKLQRLNKLRRSLALIDMPQTRSISAPSAMKKGKGTFKKTGDEIVPIGLVEGQNSPLELDEGSEEQEACLDLSDPETEAWLRRIKLWEFANLPWSEWEKNPCAKEQFDYLKSTGGFVTQQMQVTPSYVAAAFQLPHTKDPSVLKVTDQMMRMEFGSPEGTKGYFMVRNAPPQRRSQCTWFLTNVCMLVKNLYMSKESYAVLHSAEKGLNIDWGSLLHEKLQFYAGLRDKRRQVSVERLAPYMAGLFTYRDWLRSDLVQEEPKVSMKEPAGSGNLKRKLQYMAGSSMQITDEADLLDAGYSKQDVLEAVAKKKPSLVVFDAERAGVSKPEAAIVGHKLKMPKRKGAGGLTLQAMGSSVPSTPVTPAVQMIVSTAMEVAMRPEEAITKLYSVQHYIRQQAKYAERQRIVMEDLGKQVAETEAAGLDALRKEIEELKGQNVQLKKQHKEEMLSVQNSTAVFRQWTEVFKQECRSEWAQAMNKVAEVQAENEFLQSRIAALSELEGEILEDNQVQGVIIATEDVDVMKKAVTAHASELWEGLLIENGGMDF